MSISRDEQETTISYNVADEKVQIYSCVPKHVRKMLKDDRYTLVEQGEFEGTLWGKFTIPTNEWNPVTGAKRRSNLSAEQREALANRMRNLHKE